MQEEIFRDPTIQAEILLLEAKYVANETESGYLGRKYLKEFNKDLGRLIGESLSKYQEKVLEVLQGMKLPPEAGYSTLDSEEKRRTAEVNGYNQALNEAIERVKKI